MIEGPPSIDMNALPPIGQGMVQSGPLIQIPMVAGLAGMGIGAQPHILPAGVPQPNFAYHAPAQVQSELHQIQRDSSEAARAELAITEFRERKREEKEKRKTEKRDKEPKEMIVPRKDAKK